MKKFHCSNVTNEILVRMIKNNIEILDVSFCPLLTDELFDYDLFKNVKKLICWNCNFTNFNKLYNCEFIDCYFCKNITNSSIDKLLKLRKVKCFGTKISNFKKYEFLHYYDEYSNLLFVKKKNEFPRISLE